MVIRYTSEPLSDNMEGTLEAWELCAAAVLHRENLLGRLLSVQEVCVVHLPNSLQMIHLNILRIFLMRKQKFNVFNSRDMLRS